MRIPRSEATPPYSARREAAFTMVEIALCLAIVAFALVAIMGILPTGMTVQRDNREDTVISQDGVFWLEALRSGSRGIDDLTNYVESILISNHLGRWERKINPGPNAALPLTSEEVIGLLTTPKYQVDSKGVRVTNVVTARCRSINGAAAEKGSMTNDFAFRYELRVEVIPVEITPPDANSRSGLAYNSNQRRAYDNNLTTNLTQLRLTLRWPAFQQGDGWAVGRGRKTLRAIANGRRLETNMITTGRASYFVEPNTYAQ